MDKPPTKALENKPRRGGFQKGVSGNPGGRPKIARDVREAAGAQSLKAIEILASIMNSDIRKDSDRIAACNAILDRAIGKPAPAPIDPSEVAAPQRLVIELNRWDWDSTGTRQIVDSTTIGEQLRIEGSEEP